MICTCTLNPSLDYYMQRALILAAKNGVDVRILTPHIPDKWYVFEITQANYLPLIEAGVKIYQYTPGFVHTKNFVSDDCVAIVGTVNTDYRSYYLHFECGVLMYDVPAVMAVRIPVVALIVDQRQPAGGELHADLMGTPGAQFNLHQGQAVLLLQHFIRQLAAVAVLLIGHRDHAAKGLEFDTVFVSDMNDGIFPNERALADGKKGVEEERRLAYVAFTRARNKLFLTEAGGFSYILQRVRTRSRFIDEIDPAYIEHLGATFEQGSGRFHGPVPGTLL